MWIPWARPWAWVNCVAASFDASGSLVIAYPTSSDTSESLAVAAVAGSVFAGVISVPVPVVEYQFDLVPSEGGGIAINTAHELGHKRESAERWLSKVALAPTAYGHFFVEHNRGHHTRVATAEDPASARLGESFWQFWPRTVLGSLRSAWRLESRRFSPRRRSLWTPRNEILNAWAMTAVLFGVLALMFGPAVLPFLLAQAVLGFSLLEVVNYLEHYGLARQRTATGRYEKVDERHSWNSNRLTTNIFLYQLQRHSDHHANPTRRYQALRSFDTSPQLPAGYATMIVVALIPPLWRRIMDPRVLAHYGGDLRRPNVHPPARARLAARYGPQPTAGGLPASVR